MPSTSAASASAGAPLLASFLRQYNLQATILFAPYRLITYDRLGDVFDTLMALMVFRTCNQVKLPTALRSRMML